MNGSTLRKWSFVHTWSSLVCTVFLIILGLTGLPLVFSDEIEDFLDDSAPFAAVAADAPRANMDSLLKESRRRYPGEIVSSISIDSEAPRVRIALAPSWREFGRRPQTSHFLSFDAHSGRLLTESTSVDKRSLTFMEAVRRLHVELFAGLPGELFLASMALLFVVAIVSGVLLYGPFMKRLRFGTVRADRSTRLKWLDLHKLLGTIVLMWTAVVGLTGLMNELSTPLFSHWRETDVRTISMARHGTTLSGVETSMRSVDAVYQVAQRALPDRTVTSILLPGNPFGSSTDFLVWSKGNTTLTSQLLTPALVDAETGALIAVMTMPGYLRALEVSRPLHFGDYGGWRLKILWCALDVISLIVLGSGVYLWFARRQARTDQSEGPSIAPARSRAPVG